MATIVNLHKECPGCPTSWFGVDDMGNRYYIRYRWGNLKVFQSDGNKPHSKESPDWEFRIGDDADGRISQKEMEEILTERTPIWFNLEATRRPEMQELLDAN